MLSPEPMTPSQAKAQVLADFAGEGTTSINCAQAVLRYWMLVHGHDTDLSGIAAQFGGGIARMGEVCGAVAGAALALGLRDHLAECEGLSVDRTDTRAELQALMRAFAAELGSLRCGELTGVDLSTPDGHDLFDKSGGNERCQVFVAWVCDHLPI